MEGKIFFNSQVRDFNKKKLAQAIPTHSMSIFKIPRALCDAINSIVANYWQGQSKDEKKIHWIN